MPFSFSYNCQHCFLFKNDLFLGLLFFFFFFVLFCLFVFIYLLSSLALKNEKLLGIGRKLVR